MYLLMGTGYASESNTVAGAAIFLLLNNLTSNPSGLTGRTDY